MRMLFIFAVSLLTFAGSISLLAEDILPHDAHKMHICAFHIAKDDPSIVIETQHYCAHFKDNLFQCLLYETTAKGVPPKLLGVEYVITDDVYQTLSADEKSLWHPHDFEVREGLLATIGLPAKEDQEVMKTLVKTWGKTWHTWPDPKTDLPLGAPRLMWSATKPGDVPQKLIQERDERWDINTKELKKERDSYLPR